MTMIGVLEWGKYSLDINDLVRYKLGNGFAPPATALSSFFASGTNANRYRGSVKVGERAHNMAWSFPVICIGASEAETNRAVGDLTNFINYAGDDVTPLYFAFRGNNNIAAEPSWGQYGTNLRFEITHADTPRIDTATFDDTIQAFVKLVIFSVSIRPFGYGKSQTLCTAEGGILEKRFGATDGRSLGLLIHEGTTNLHLNPYFGHATWNNGWTNGASLTDTQNTDPDFIIEGASSAKLTATAATNNTYTESITLAASAHTLSYYVKLPDSSAVSTTQVNISYNGSNQTTTFTSVGDGWYRLTAAVTGTGGAAATGIVVSNKYTVYFDMAQAEAKAYQTAPCHGAMLGCAWTGTAHASSSTRTAAGCYVPSALNIGEGTVRVVWKPDIDEVDMESAGQNGVLFVDGTSGMKLSHDSVDQEWEFTDGTNLAADTTAFLAGNVIVFHAVYEPAAGLVLYVDGASVATNATYTPAAMGDMYIGSSSTPNDHINGTFLDVAVFDTAISAAEALADFNNITQVLSDGQRLASIPWLWTKDGDNVVDNANDSSYDNFAIIHGVGGDMPAHTMFDITLSSTPPVIGDLWLSLLDTYMFFDPGNLYTEKDGTVDATSSNGQYLEVAVGAVSAVQEADSTSYTPDVLAELSGRRFRPFIRLYDAGSDLTVRTVYFISSGQQVSTDYLAISPTTALRTFQGPDLDFHLPEKIINKYFAGTFNTVAFGVDFIRTTGSANIRIDYIQPLFYPIVRMTADNSGPYTGLIFGSDGHMTYINNQYDGAAASGSFGLIELVPDKYNALISVIGSTSVTNTITNTATYNTIHIKPRWRLLQ